jgi:tRNA A37 threonylcarbamoyladenosine biosynthesis protein TsaE
LGVADPVTSPTFTLVHECSGRLRLFHLMVSNRQLTRSPTCG